MFRLLFISGIVDRITVGQLHVGTVLIFYGGIVIGLFLKVITNSFGGESEASVRDFCTVLLRHFLPHSLPFQNPVFFCHHIILTVLLLPLIPLDQLGIQRGLLHLQPLHLRGLLLQQLL